MIYSLLSNVKKLPCFDYLLSKKIREDVKKFCGKKFMNFLLQQIINLATSFAAQDSMTRQQVHYFLCLKNYVSYTFRVEDLDTDSNNFSKEVAFIHMYQKNSIFIIQS